LPASAGSSISAVDGRRSATDGCGKLRQARCQEPASPSVLQHRGPRFVAFAGKRRGDKPWPAGHYDGHVELVRDNGVIATNVVAFDLK